MKPGENIGGVLYRKEGNSQEALGNSKEQTLSFRPWKDIEEPRDSFIRNLMLEDRALNTIKGARYSLGIFLKFLRTHGIRDIRGITDETLAHFMKSERERVTKDGSPLSKMTILTRLCVLSKFFLFLRKKGHILFNPMEGYKLPKAPNQIPRDIMTDREMKKFLSLPNTRSLYGYRDRTMLELLYSTGMRASELINLKLGDLSLMKREIKVQRGKGGRARIIPLNHTAVLFLQGYLKRIRPKIILDEKDDILFVSHQGKKMCYEAFRSFMAGYREKAGFRKNITSHSFRHTVATELLEAGMDIRFIQVFLGHSALKSTQVYTRVVKNSLREKHHKFHPREQLNAIPKFNGKKRLWMWATKEGNRQQA